MTGEEGKKKEVKEMEARTSWHEPQPEGILKSVSSKKKTHLEAIPAKSGFRRKRGVESNRKLPNFQVKYGG